MSKRSKGGAGGKVLAIFLLIILLTGMGAIAYIFGKPILVKHLNETNSSLVTININETSNIVENNIDNSGQANFWSFLTITLAVMIPTFLIGFISLLLYRYWSRRSVFSAKNKEECIKSAVKHITTSRLEIDPVPIWDLQYYGLGKAENPRYAFAFVTPWANRYYPDRHNTITLSVNAMTLVSTDMKRGRDAQMYEEFLLMQHRGKVGRPHDPGETEKDATLQDFLNPKKTQYNILPDDDGEGG